MSDKPQDYSEKKNALNKGLEHSYLLAHINTRSSSDLRLPAHLLSTPTVTLKLSFYFAGKLELLDHSIVTELRFGDEYFECHIPWSSIWGITTELGQNLAWPEDMPAELLAAQNINTTKEERNRPSLAPISSKKSKTTGSKKKPITKSHLQRIK